ncbi:MAG: hypothetical protein ACRDE8_11045, partial [Ginsengibacter sp.]
MFTQRSLRFPVLLCIITLLASCNGNNSTGTAAATDSTSVSSADTMSSANTANAIPQPANLIDSYLDTLWVSVADFSVLQNRRLAFRFYIDSTESVLMNGWTVKINGDYPPNPDLSLSKGRTSTVQYKAGDYLGNLLLSGADIVRLKLLISQNVAKYVLFAPIDPATASFKGQVTYNILLTIDDPQPFAKPVNAVIATGIKTNPSPPGTAN